MAQSVGFSNNAKLCAGPGRIGALANLDDRYLTLDPTASVAQCTPSTWYNPIAKSAKVEHTAMEQ